ncbi:ABC transporter ATP-binding protein [Rhodalgimonas zhirmunskyi]|uniref:ABC transporter ATP-binding protein/permease n=1 Tax=Rhodalgimonas zhirmunskyi TaxID=2964767 RepID=A0AAJ1X8G0_9RHOB|nr:ABC transporter ATP-binding protein [Rhodoalgimonas zhirmunskyi]MDQ2095587.1 ABC transporter ATP-binding protein/permease [Rhodoalgimonas zhirmunskyi]
MSAAKPTAPKPTPEAHTSSRPLIAWLWRGYLRQHLGLVMLSVLFMAIEGSMQGALALMMKPMFDQVFTQGDRAALFWVGLGVLAIFIIRALAGAAQKTTVAYISQNATADMRRDLLEHTMRQDGPFHQAHPPGFLIQRVQTDVQAINTAWPSLMTGIGRDVISLVVLMGVAISVDWRWTLVALIGAPILVAPSQLVQKFVRARAREARDLGARLATRLDEVFHGIIPVKLNRLEQYQSDRYRALSDDLVRAQVRSVAGAATIPGLVDVMAGLGFFGVLWFGGGEIISGEKTVGEFMSFFTAIGFAFEPLRRMGALAGLWQVAASGIERIKELMDVQPTITSPKMPKPAPDGVPGISMQDVQLSYGETRVLDGLTLTCEPGQTTALVGPSGAGKSTIFNLLTRLIDPQEGHITIGGVAVNEMNLHDLRNLFSVVSQDPALFDETLRENILLGRTDISDEQLQEVLKAAHVSDFLPKLEKGLDTPVGPRGSALSGGQRQRVAIARALLRDTPILLLDEATSALDAESEKVVQEALDRLSEGRTTIVIAHRLSTVRHADKIVVMERGTVVDQGPHAELMDRGGLYARLHDLQFRDSGPSADSVVRAAQVRRRKESEAAARGSAHRDESSLLKRIWRRLSGQ